MSAPYRPVGAYRRGGWLRSYPLTLGLGVALLALALSSFTLVRAGEVAVVLRLGQPVRLAGPGLDWHWPLAERVVRLDRRTQPLLIERLAVPAADGQRLEVDALVRLDLVDPLRVVRGAATAEAAESALRAAFTPVIGAALGRRPAGDLLAIEGQGLLGPLAAALDARAAPLGMRVRGVELVRLGLAGGNAGETALARMAERLKDEAQVERERGQRDARLAQADAEARAGAITARAYGQDPEFYDFWRAMQSYNAVLGGPADKGGTTIVVGPDSDYLRQFRGGGGK